MKSSKNVIILTKQREGFVLTHIMPFIESYSHERHHSSKLLVCAVTIFKNQTENKYGMIRANLSRDTNEGVVMHCKTITSKLLIIEGLLVEPSTSIAQPKVF